MTIYIKWKITKDEQFRVKYLNITKERIQDTPLINEEETHYMVGSSRITQLQILNLQLFFPLSAYFGETHPSDWITKTADLT